MLSRRLQRIKVLQALYAFFQKEDESVAKAEKELFHSLQRVYELYIFFMLLPLEIVREAERKMEEGKQKNFPTPEELNPNRKFIENGLLHILRKHKALHIYSEQHKINWQLYDEEIRKFFAVLRQHEVYKNYMNKAGSCFEDDKKCWAQIYRQVLPEFDLFFDAFQEKSVYWSLPDIDYALFLCIKTFEQAEEADGIRLSPIYKDAEEDTVFVAELFRKTIKHASENEEYIREKTQNWDVERIAYVDILILKMAITEFLHFPSVPVKVTLNEYIEISKGYSSPNSKVFINGVLDKLLIEFKAAKKLNKQGKGLIDN